MSKIIRYSEAFKLQVMEEIKTGKWKNPHEAKIAYNLGGETVSLWMDKYGLGHLKQRIMIVKTTKEVDEIKRLKAENRQLKNTLADTTVDLHFAKGFLDIACKQLGTTPEDLKKKSGIL